MKPPDEHISSKASILPYYILGAICFFIFHILLLRTIPTITTHFFQPKLLSITHLFIIGWGTIIIFGASNQIIPVITETSLYKSWIAKVVAVILILGVSIMAFSFWNFYFVWITYAAAGLVLGGLGLHSYNIFKTISKGKGSIITDLLLMSHAWLLITAFLGLLLLINMVTPIFPEEHIYYLKIHAPIGMAGWFLQLIIGVSSRLVPMFILTRKEEPRLLHVSFYAINIGLALFLIESMVFKSVHGKYIYLLLIGIGLIAYAIYIKLCYSNGLRKQLDAGMKQTFIAMLFIAVSSVLLAIILHSDNTMQPNIYIAFGFSFFCGLISIMIMGQTFKTLPFIIWIYVTKPDKLPELMPKDLYKERLVQLQLIFYLPGIVLLLSGLVFLSNILLYSGATLMLAGSFTYMAHVLFVVGKLKIKSS